MGELRGYMDINNRVVKLCVEGMMAEGQGRCEQARDLFAQAWAASTGPFEACVAAHYLARHQDHADDSLHWNQEALRQADAAGDDRVHDFYPSLYLNLGRSYEEVGKLQEARRYYELAAERVDDLPADRYGVMVRHGITAGRQRANAWLCDVDGGGEVRP